MVAGLIMASLGFLFYYYFSAPNANLSTYNELTALAYSDEYLDFDENLDEMNGSYIEGGEINSFYKVVNNALSNNFNHYKSYLLFVSDVSASDQTHINGKIIDYKDSFLETDELLNYFIDYNAIFNEATKEGAHKNFIVSYNETIKLYVELIEALQDYVIKYSFNNATPVGLKQTLLQAQFDFAKAIINEQLTLPENEEDPIIVTDATLFNELNAVINKYANFTNSPQGDNHTALNFIEAYNNLENKADYFKSVEKSTYVATLENNTAASIVHSFLTRSSYN
jgi:hypothetical protein